MRRAAPFVVALAVIIGVTWLVVSLGGGGSKPKSVERNGRSAGGVNAGQLATALTKNDEGQGEVQVSAVYLAPRLQQLLESSGGGEGAGAAELKAFLQLVSLAPENERQLAFILSINTHSVPLESYDPAKFVYLVNDRGDKIRPAAWKSLSNESHHRSGVLLFKNAGNSFVFSQTKFLKLGVTRLAGVPERILKFEAPGKYL